MRITGGTLAGRLVKVPDGVIRPAMDRMRESVFAGLGDISGKSFLDLFSVSGIIALEAASRGADRVEAVEKDRVKSSTLIENARIASARIQCRFMAAELYIKRAPRLKELAAAPLDTQAAARRAFDIIFCDPPFPYQFKG